MRAHLNRMVPSTDGVRLATDVYLPDGPGPFPVVFTRTPYNKVSQQPGPNNPGGQVIERGYALVVQDTRGKYESTGTPQALLPEADDGLASLDWIANQTWCNGRIGLRGASYLGIVQAPTAMSQHPALKAICPTIAPGSHFRDWIRHDGCFALYNPIRWLFQHGTRPTVPPDRHFTWEQTWKCRTVDEVESLVGMALPFLRTIAEHDTYDGFWRSVDQALMYEKITVPAYHGGCWFDHISRNMTEAFASIRADSPSGYARQHQHLLMGPWGHMNYSTGDDRQRTYGDWDFGDQGVFPVVPTELDFLDHYVREIDNGFDQRPRVRLFIMGANRWHTTSDWPPADAENRHWFLTSKGDAAGPTSAGTLDPVAPTRDAADTVSYDPNDPVQTLGGPIYWGHEEQLPGSIGPRDQTPLLKRHDVRYYRSDRLDSPVTICGSPSLDLHLQADVEDTDVMVKLCVEQGDRKDVITLGSLRLRYREGFEMYTPLPKGEPVKATVHLLPTCYRFPAGSRIGVIVTHSDWPRIEPHPNVIAPPLSGATYVTASIALLHGPSHASRLSLPVVPW